MDGSLFSRFLPQNKDLKGDTFDGSQHALYSYSSPTENIINKGNQIEMSRILFRWHFLGSATVLNKRLSRRRTATPLRKECSPSM